jgi:hypothetical protein
VWDPAILLTEFPPPLLFVFTRKAGVPTFVNVSIEDFSIGGNIAEVFDDKFAAGIDTIEDIVDVGFVPSKKD